MLVHDNIQRYSITEEGVKICLSEILEVNAFSRPLLERNYMRRSFSIENISFSRNCDIKTTKAKSVTDASMWVMFIFKNRDTIEIAEHSLLNPPIIIRCYGFHFRSTDLTDKHLKNRGSGCKQTWTLL